MLAQGWRCAASGAAALPLASAPPQPVAGLVRCRGPSCLAPAAMAPRQESDAPLRPGPQSPPPDVAPELLLELQQAERLCSNSHSSTSAVGGAPSPPSQTVAPIVPRTRTRLARAPHAPGFRTPQATVDDKGAGGQPPSALDELLARLGAAQQRGAGGPWGPALCAQVGPES
jgi:hypothetical protein